MRGALAEVERAGGASVALPILGAGHASFPFDRAVRAIAEALASSPLAVPRVVLVIFDRDRLPGVRQILDDVLARSGPPRR